MTKTKTESHNDTKFNRREMITTGLGTLGLSAISCSLCEGQGGGRGRGGNGGPPIMVDPANLAIMFNPNRCERCGDCARFCNGVTTVYGYGPELSCIHCGQCTLVCQGQALTERYNYPAVRAFLAKKEYTAMASIAPSVPVTLGESFGMMPGTDVTGKLVAGLKQVGFKYVFDTSFAADMTVMEEATELVRRLKKKAEGPLFTSCCPAWVRFAELFYPECLPNISTVKSPFMIQGALAKTWLAEKNDLDPTKILNIAIAPCTAKKSEIRRLELSTVTDFIKSGSFYDVDYALTTREVVHLLRGAGVTQLISMKSEPYDPILGAASGAGMLFGNSGGVLEAALRTAYWMINDEDPPASLLNWEEMRTATTSIRTAKVDLKKYTIHVAAVYGTANIRVFLDELKKGQQKYDFVEMMACPGGCIGGGGQPRTTTASAIKRRATAVYRRDEKNTIRTSYSNPDVQAIYRDFLKEPGSTQAIALLHRSGTANE